MVQNYSDSFFANCRPGVNPCPDAIKRFAQKFEAPEKLLLAEITQSKESVGFADIYDCDPPDLPAELLQRILTEITWCIATNGRGVGDSTLAADWFYFLLPHVIKKSYERLDRFGYLIESVVAAAIATNFSYNSSAPYRNFRFDLVVTVGQSMVSDCFWQNERLRPGFVSEELEEWSFVPTCAGPISAWIYFNLFFLEPIEMDSWVQAMLLIEDSFWRANLLSWLAAARNLECADPFKIASDESAFKSEVILCIKLTCTSNLRVKKRRRIPAIAAAIRQDFDRIHYGF